MSEQQGPSVLVQRDGYVGRIVLSRPQRLNALTADMLKALQAALRDLAEDTGVRTIVLTGAGRAFCAGQDLSERDPRQRSEPFDLEAIQRRSYHPILQLMRATPKPVVTVVNGLAAGAGVALALAGDIVVMRETARFVFSFVKVGLSVDAGLGWSLVKALGPMKARTLLMLGGELSAREAATMGLVSECIADDAFVAQAEHIVKTLAAGPAMALAGLKRAVDAAATTSDWDHYLAVEAQCQGAAGFDPDYREGVLAFLEKRAPKWRGLN
ncbi:MULTISPECIES: enoyl-CoA hydratase-related protein [unclassified Beijerinckia]|uniref:enoyl-CoA hydratase-related protein n=1 Tax=unclassified Beijerinckia TaxID=2638183 RepID=UPI00089A90C3|nr:MULTISPECIES: enoyl-CoA hydratase-related protein [unclassified Beijerinckia]MDH7798626.1 2-(1,2-epoxy-1,2-dihydrophenyl)acetyl-CoA isomerase [Beijerinckia sp. GAS462]SED27156.1 Enoyl-CoA hydratase [Beijerinckia sp. 28-YEA-48]